MSVVIRVPKSELAKTWGILVRHFPGMALRNRTFVLAEPAVRALQQAGIKFKLISQEGIHVNLNGEYAGERV